MVRKPTIRINDLGYDVAPCGCSEPVIHAPAVVVIVIAAIVINPPKLHDEIE